ncbi:MAG: hypothetical protein LBK71_06750 [Verrucomicrobiales bacterium]|nr:hypothetical protein [Verrucomicrobiales bacterium]
MPTTEKFRELVAHLKSQRLRRHVGMTGTSVKVGYKNADTTQKRLALR